MDFEQKFRLWAINFLNGPQNCIVHVRGNVLTKYFFLKKLQIYFFPNFGRKVFGLWAVFFRQGCCFKCQVKNWGKILLCRKTYENIFLSDFEQKYLNFQQKNSAGISRLPCTCPKNVWGLGNYLVKKVRSNLQCTQPACYVNTLFNLHSLKWQTP